MTTADAPATTPGRVAWKPHGHAAPHAHDGHSTTVHHDDSGLDRPETLVRDAAVVQMESTASCRDAFAFFNRSKAAPASVESLSILTVVARYAFHCS